MKKKIIKYIDLIHF